VANVLHEGGMKEGGNRVLNVNLSIDQSDMTNLFRALLTGPKGQHLYDTGYVHQSALQAIKSVNKTLASLASSAELPVNVKTRRWD
jgi:hypothetical protein